MLTLTPPGSIEIVGCVMVLAMANCLVIAAFCWVLISVSLLDEPPSPSRHEQQQPILEQQQPIFDSLTCMYVGIDIYLPF